MKKTRKNGEMKKFVSPFSIPSETAKVSLGKIVEKILVHRNLVVQIANYDFQKH
jgi:hypothetical protein